MAFHLNYPIPYNYLLIIKAIIIELYIYIIFKLCLKILKIYYIIGKLIINIYNLIYKNI